MSGTNCNINGFATMHSAMVPIHAIATYQISTRFHLEGILLVGFSKTGQFPLLGFGWNFQMVFIISYLRIPAMYEVINSKICNFWTFWPVIQLIHHLFLSDFEKMV